MHFGLPYSNDMGPAEDGVKSDLGKPLPEAQGAGPAAAAAAAQRERWSSACCPTTSSRSSSATPTEAVEFIAAQQGQAVLPVPGPQRRPLPDLPGQEVPGKSPHGIFSDWVEEVDWSVGQVLDAVREHGLAEKTLVIFTSDNGGTPRSVNAPAPRLQGEHVGGRHARADHRLVAGQDPGRHRDAMPSPGCSTSCRRSSRWPAGKLPADRTIDGGDIWPHLAGAKDAKPAHETFYYYRGLRLEAVRHGDWKLHVVNPAAKADAKDPAFTPRLYNLKTDIGEATDVAAAHPDVVRQIERWSRR